MNYSIVVRGGRGEDTWAGLVFYIREFGIIKWRLSSIISEAMLPIRTT
jgi:hypothetical protein